MDTLEKAEGHLILSRHSAQDFYENPKLTSFLEICIFELTEPGETITRHKRITVV